MTVTTTRPAYRPSARPAVRAEVVWAVVGAIVAAALVIASLYIAPAVLGATIAGLVCVYLAAFLPKAFALVAVTVIVLSNVLQNTVGTVASSADEAVIALSVIAFCTRRLVTERRLVLLPGTFWFLGFFAFGVASTIAQHASYSTMVESAILIAKGLLFAFALAQLRWTQRDIRILVVAGIVAIAMMALTGLLNLVFPAFWSSLVARGSGGVGPHVAGIPVLQGLFQHPAAFGRFCSVLAVAAVSYACVVRTSIGNMIMIGVAGFLAMLTFEVKSIVGLIVSAGLIVVRFSRPVLLFAALCIGPVIAAVAIPPLSALIGGAIETYILQDSARSTLTLGSLHVASTHFPLGAGFGRYGSYPAGVSYSPEYYALGFDHVYGLGPGDKGMFLNDTQWPAIVGESGWLGAICFAAGSLVILVFLLRPVGPDEPVLTRWLRIAGAGWLILLMIESSAAPVFVSAPSFPFVFAAAGMVASLRTNARDEARQRNALAARASGSRLPDPQHPRSSPARTKPAV